MKIQQYEFDVTYQQGKANPSDYFSRNPKLTETKTPRR